MQHDEAIMRQLYKCIERVVKDVDAREKAMEELSLYIKGKGVFGMDLAIRKMRPKHQVSYLNLFITLYFRY